MEMKDLFKQKSMSLADGLDWNCKCCKRSKGDTKLIHKQARKKLKKDLEKLLTS
jgi:hypothetical protein